MINCSKTWKAKFIFESYLKLFKNLKCQIYLWIIPKIVQKLSSIVRSFYFFILWMFVEIEPSLHLKILPISNPSVYNTQQISSHKLCIHSNWNKKAKLFHLNKGTIYCIHCGIITWYNLNLEWTFSVTRHQLMNIK
jgi:hypothetical protein